jgi:hypothetical protein
MAADRIQAINDLLVQTQEAHAAFESTELNGVYDTEWPSWYATYAVDHGFGALVGRDVTVDELAGLLTSGQAAFEATVPRPSESWAAFTARRLAEAL